jgi:hypothetical protein
MRGNMRKILLFAVFLFIVAVANTFGQTDSTRVLEISDDFTEIMDAFQKRLYAALAEFKYFHHQLEGFVVNLEYEDELSKKTKKDINKNQYFIFETTDRGIYYLTLVNKENANAIVFYFINYSSPLFGEKNRSSRVNIDKALALYPDL